MTQAILAAEVAMHVLLKSTVVVGCAYMCVLMLRRSSAALRHAVWCAALASLLLLPVLPSPLPALRINAATLFVEQTLDDSVSRAGPLPSPSPAAEFAPPGAPALVGRADAKPGRTASGADSGASSGGFALPEYTRADWLLGIWTIGAFLLLMRFAFGFLQALLLRRDAEPVPADPLLRRAMRGIGLRRNVRAFYAPRARTPLTYGLFRPVMLLPKGAQQWPPERVRIVMEHELAHVERWDYATHLLTQLVSAFYWPNPLVWLALRRVRTEQEQACDDRVIAWGTESCTYAEHLLHVAKTCMGLPHTGAIALAQRHTLKERVQSILNARADRRPVSLRVGLVALFAAIVLAIPLAALQPADPAELERAEQLDALQHGPTPDRLRAASYFAVHVDTAALQPLLRLATAPGSSVRAAALSALAAYRQGAATRTLVSALEDSSDRVVAIAEAALAGRDFPHVRAALERLYERRARMAVAAETLPANAYLFLEAEQGRLMAPMSVYEDAKASGSAFVYVADQDGHDAPDGGPGAVSLAFELETAGEYVVWGRIKSPNDSDNSFFVSIDESRELIWDVPGPEYTDVARDWTWDAVSARDPETNQIANPIVYTLEAGNHILRVRNREDGTRLDGVVITNDLAYVPVGIAPATPPASPRYVWLQAEEALLAQGMRIGEDASAAGRHFVWLPDGDGNDAPAGGPAAATLSFSIEHSDAYVAWARVQAPHTNDNSFFVSFDGADERVWHAPGPDPSVIAREWTWSRVPIRHDADARDEIHPTPLAPGSHTIRFRVREDGTRIDALLLTNDQTFRPRGVGMAPPRRAAFLWREAEDAEIEEPLRIAGHREASGNAFILVDHGSSRSQPPTEGSARYQFEVAEGGSYALWGRVSIEDRDGDSFWIRFDDGPWIRWNGIDQGRRWHWAELHDSDAPGAPVRIDMTPGLHTVEVRYREAGAMLDRLLLTNDQAYVPTGTGAASQGVLATASRIEVVF